MTAAAIGLAPDALTGSYPPLVTPFLDGAIDLDTYALLVARQALAGSAGVTVCGTTGEPSMLTVDERKQLLERAVAAAAGALAVMAATGSESLATTLELTAHAAASGVAAILVVTPYYSKPPQRGLVAYFDAVAEASGEVPLLLYHIPGRAGVGVTVDTLAAIAARVPTFVGMKHAADDVAFVTAATQVLGTDFRVFVGKEDLTLPMIAAGASGAVNAVGNLAPAEVQQLCVATRAGRLAEADAINRTLLELNQAVFWDTNPIPMKYLMWRLDLLPTDEHRLPMVPPDPALAARLDALLARTPWLAR